MKPDDVTDAFKKMPEIIGRSIEGCDFLSTTLHNAHLAITSGKIDEFDLIVDELESLASELHRRIIGVKVFCELHREANQ